MQPQKYFLRSFEVCQAIFISAQMLLMRHALYTLAIRKVIKKLAISILVVLILVAAYFAYIKYQDHKFIDLVVPHVKNTSLRLANVLRYETKSGEMKTTANITYNELFEKIESDIIEVDKKILEIQTITTASHKEQSDLISTSENGI